jgi:hypothetical protein
MFFHDEWPLQVRPLSWLLEHFKPVPGWHDSNDGGALAEVYESGQIWGKTHFYIGDVVPAVPGLEKANPVKGAIYYTDSKLDPAIAIPVRTQLKRAARDMPIVTAALGHTRLDLGVKNIIFPKLKRGHLAMFHQILAALIHSPADVVFFCEHDVLYHPSHFDFTPPRADTFYYDGNVWLVRIPDGHALYYEHRSLSQMCCYRELAIAHYQKKIARVEANGGQYDAKMGFEPGTRGTHAGGIDDSPCGDWRAAEPSLDLRHDGNLTRSRWSKDKFRDQKYTAGWTEASDVPGWGETEGHMAELLGSLQS